MTPDHYNANRRIRNFYRDEDEYVKESMRDMDRLRSLLEKMNENMPVQPDTVSSTNLKERIAGLIDYLNRHNLRLTQEESAQLQKTVESPLSSPVIRRTLDDLIHRIRKRVEKELDKISEEEALENDIRLLENPGPGLISWLYITIFALRFGTLTPFSHKVRSYGIDILTTALQDWLNILKGIIEPVLAKEYYAFTPREYNSLALILQLKEAADEFSVFREIDICENSALDEPSVKFACIYVAVILNSSTIEKAFSKIERARKLQHGARGTLMLVLDRPLRGNLPMHMDMEYKTMKTITGALATIFTAKEGVIVSNINQIQYLTGAEGNLDTIRRNLIPAAQKEEEENRKRLDSEITKLEARRDFLVRIIDEYMPKAPALAERILKGMARSSYEAWKTEHQSHPLLRIRRIISGIIMFFTEALADGKSLVPMHDGKEYPAFAYSRTELVKAATLFNGLEKDLSGTREKDMTTVAIQNTDGWEESLRTILTAPTRQSGIDSGRIIRDVLSQIAARSYDLAIRSSELAQSYYSRKALQVESPEDDYTFFTEAVLKNTPGLKCRILLGSTGITFREFIESVSALCFYVAAELIHPGIEAMKNDRIDLERRISDKSGSLQEEANTGADYGMDDSLQSELDSVYRDPVTGLWNRTYFQDQIVPKIYDTHGKYLLSTQRHVFMTSFNGLPVINRLKGHDTGDRIFRIISRHISDTVLHPGCDPSDVLLRWDGNAILGFINNMPRSSVLDMIKSIHDSLDMIMIEDVPGSMLSCSTGVYTEFTNIPFEDTLSATNALMIYSCGAGDNRIAFAKNPELVISQKMISQRDDSLASFVSLI